MNTSQLDSFILQVSKMNDVQKRFRLMVEVCCMEVIEASVSISTIIGDCPVEDAKEAIIQMFANRLRNS